MPNLSKCTGPGCPLCAEQEPHVKSELSSPELTGQPEIPWPAGESKYAMGGVIKASKLKAKLGEKQPKAEFSQSEVEQLASTLQECAKSYGVPGMTAFAAQAVAEKFLADQKSALLAKTAVSMSKVSESLSGLKEYTEAVNESASQLEEQLFDWYTPPGGLLVTKNPMSTSGFGMATVIRSTVHVLQVSYDYTYGEDLQELRASVTALLTEKAKLFSRVLVSEAWVSEFDEKESRLKAAAYVMRPVSNVGADPTNLKSYSKLKIKFVTTIQEINNLLAKTKKKKEAKYDNVADETWPD